MALHTRMRECGATQKHVKVLLRGRLYSGTYCVANDFVSVSLDRLRTTAKSAVTEPSRLAEFLLQQLARRRDGRRQAATHS